MPKPNIENHDIIEIVKSATRFFEDSYKNISFKKEINLDKNLIDCDAGQIDRVFNNIIKNAVFSINKSLNKSEGIITIKLNQKEKFIHFTIIDNGTGFVEEEKTLLQPYYTTKGKKYGSGLGLSIVEKIINDHGGFFKIKNDNLNKGAICEFTINYNN